MIFLFIHREMTWFFQQMIKTTRQWSIFLTLLHSETWRSSPIISLLRDYSNITGSLRSRG